MKSSWQSLSESLLESLAVLMATYNVGGNNATKVASKANLAATNPWDFLQAKNMRRTHYTMWEVDLERQLAAKPDVPAELRALSKSIWQNTQAASPSSHPTKSATKDSTGYSFAPRRWKR